MPANSKPTKIKDSCFATAKNSKKFSLNVFYNYICQKKSEMEDTKPVGAWWIMFFIAAIVQIIFLIWIREYFWMILPWWLTAFAKAMRLI